MDKDAEVTGESELENLIEKYNEDSENADEKERLKIIYVDDVSTSLLSFKRRLSGRYEVYPAQSAEILFKALKVITPDIIFLDINMPEVDGYEIIKTLKENKYYTQIPVVFFTSNNDRESVLKGLSLGAADYIIKPFDTSSLIECIEKHVTAGKANKKIEEDSRQRILAVDDVVSILKTIKAALHNDYIVHTISRAESVMDFLKLRKPDLILLDYLMPIHNGFELIPMIREIPGYDTTPIIMLTSEGTLTHIKEAISLGACDFIVKPFKDIELKEKIAKHIKSDVQ